MFSNGHAMVTSCLFLQYNPSSLMHQHKEIGYAECKRWERHMCVVPNASFLLF